MVYGMRRAMVYAAAKLSCIELSYKRYGLRKSMTDATKEMAERLSYLLSKLGAAILSIIIADALKTETEKFARAAYMHTSDMLKRSISLLFLLNIHEISS